MKTAIDTIFFRLIDPEVRKKKRKGESVSNKNTLKFNISKNSTIDIYSDIKITSSNPIVEVNYDSIWLVRFKDSVEIDESYSSSSSNVEHRSFFLKVNWIPDTRYVLTVMPGAVKDIYGMKHDTTIINFSTPSLEYYGNLAIELSGIRTNMVVQILDGGQVKYSKSVNSNGILHFDNLAPQKYSLRLVYDVNNNGKWDTGDFSKRLQPEEVYYYQQEINIRSNWDVKVQIAVP